MYVIHNIDVSGDSKERKKDLGRIRKASEKLEKARNNLQENSNNSTYLDYVAATKEYSDALNEGSKILGDLIAEADRLLITCRSCNAALGLVTKRERIAFVYEKFECLECLGVESW